MLLAFMLTPYMLEYNNVWFPCDFKEPEILKMILIKQMYLTSFVYKVEQDEK